MGRADKGTLAWGVGLTLLLLLPVVGGLPGHPSGAPGVSRAGVLPSKSPMGYSGLRPTAPTAVPATGGGQGRLLVTSADPSIVPNDGVRVNVSAFASQQFPPNSAFQVGAEETIGGFEAVFGIFENTGTLPTAFFSVFTNRTDVNVRLTYWVDLGLVAGDAYDFELLRSAGTNWSLTVNGQPFGGSAANATYDFNATAATWATGIGFSEVALYGATPTVPALLTVPLALAVHRVGTGWYLPVGGTTSYAGGGGPQWGVLGRLQHPTLAPGEIETGSQVANQTNGTALWNSGPVGVTVSVAFPAEPIVATVPSLVDITVTQSTGAPIPGVSVYLRDAENGSFPLPSVITNASGGAIGLLDTPNVTRAGPDLVTANVTLFGYRGVGTAELALTPSVQVRIAVDPASPVVPPGGRLSITLTTTNRSGAAAPDVLLTFTIAAGATITPVYGTTDSGGRLTVALTAPPNVGDLRLTIVVQDVGEWGTAVVTVHVADVVDGFVLPPLSELVGIGSLAALGVIALVVFVRVRRGRRRLPEMPLRRYLRESRAPTPPPKGPGAGAPERPPGGSDPPQP